VREPRVVLYLVRGRELATGGYAQREEALVEDRCLCQHAKAKANELHTLEFRACSIYGRRMPGRAGATQISIRTIRRPGSAYPMITSLECMPRTPRAAPSRVGVPGVKGATLEGLWLKAKATARGRLAEEWRMRVGRRRKAEENSLADGMRFECCFISAGSCSVRGYSAVRRVEIGGIES
jgi:hypothetical protein